MSCCCYSLAHELHPVHVLELDSIGVRNINQAVHLSGCELSCNSSQTQKHLHSFYTTAAFSEGMHARLKWVVRFKCSKPGALLGSVAFSTTRGLETLQTTGQLLLEPTLRAQVGS